MDVNKIISKATWDDDDDGVVGVDTASFWWVYQNGLLPWVSRSKTDNALAPSAINMNMSTSTNTHIYDVVIHMHERERVREH